MHLALMCAIARHALLMLSRASALIASWSCVLTGTYETSSSPYYNTPPRAQSCSPLLLGGFFWRRRGRRRTFAEASPELVVVYGGGSGVRLEVAWSRDLERVHDFRLRWG